jgi:hypothetical protein
LVSFVPWCFKNFVLPFCTAVGAFVLGAVGVNVLDVSIFLLTGFHLMDSHKRRLGAWGIVTFLAVFAALVALGAAPSRGQTPLASAASAATAGANAVTPTPVVFPVPGPPPISVGPVVVQNGHLTVGGQRAVFFGVNFDASAIWGLLNPGPGGAYALDPNQEAVYAAEIARMKQAGVDCVRILGLTASNINPIFLPGSGTKLDPAKVSAFKWFLGQLGQQGIRYLIALDDYRVIFPADLPANASSLAQEAVTQSWGGNPVGRLTPWDIYDPTLLGLKLALDQAIVQLVANDPACVGYELDNEDPVAKDCPWGFPANCPLLQAAFVADATGWANANCGGLNGFGAQQHNQYFAAAYGKKTQARIANLRQFTQAVLIENTYFGNGSYAMLAPMIAQTDPQTAISTHFYTRGPPTDTNGFLNGRVGQTPPDPSSRFTAVLAGCNWVRADGSKIPLLVTELGPQFQSNPSVLDPPLELVVDLPSATWQAAWQDADAIFPYSWAAYAIWAGGVSSKSGPYDLRNNAQYVRAMRGCGDVFHDLSLRPTAAQTITIAPTNGLYGSAGTPYLIYGPYTDPALYAVPAGTKVLMQLPTPATSQRSPLPVKSRPNVRGDDRHKLLTTDELREPVAAGLVPVAIVRVEERVDFFCAQPVKHVLRIEDTDSERVRKEVDIPVESQTLQGFLAHGDADHDDPLASQTDSQVVNHSPLRLAKVVFSERNHRSDLGTAAAFLKQPQQPLCDPGADAARRNSSQRHRANGLVKIDRGEDPRLVIHSERSHQGQRLIASLGPFVNVPADAPKERLIGLVIFDRERSPQISQENGKDHAVEFVAVGNCKSGEIAPPVGESAPVSRHIVKLQPRIFSLEPVGPIGASERVSCGERVSEHEIADHAGRLFWREVVLVREALRISPFRADVLNFAQCGPRHSRAYRGQERAADRIEMHRPAALFVDHECMAAGDAGAHSCKTPRAKRFCDCVGEQEHPTRERESFSDRHEPVGA